MCTPIHFLQSIPLWLFHGFVLAEQAKVRLILWCRCISLLVSLRSIVAVLFGKRISNSEDTVLRARIKLATSFQTVSDDHGTLQLGAISSARVWTMLQIARVYEGQ